MGYRQADAANIVACLADRSKLQYVGVGSLGNGPFTAWGHDPRCRKRPQLGQLSVVVRSGAIGEMENFCCGAALFSSRQDKRDNCIPVSMRLVDLICGPSRNHNTLYQSENDMPFFFS